MSLRQVFHWPGRWLAALIVLAVRVYQVTLSPVLRALGVGCRYFPSCSEYMVLAVRKYGPAVGVVKGIFRVCRCHPWAAGGYDPP